MTTSVDELTEPASTGGRSGGRLAPFIALGIAVALIGLVVLFIGADPDAPAPQGASPLLGKP
ncbi:MAG: hypothetical protein ABJ382_04225, partial [Ilumatobacter sp.]